MSMPKLKVRLKLPLGQGQSRQQQQQQQTTDTVQDSVQQQPQERRPAVAAAATATPEGGVQPAGQYKFVISKRSSHVPATQRKEDDAELASHAARPDGESAADGAAAESGAQQSGQYKVLISRRPSLLLATPRREEDEPEPDPAIEEHFLLRLPKGRLCDRFREAVRNREISEDTSFTFKSERGAIFEFGGEKYRATLVDLPTLLESHKTFDNRQLFKIADICQMLIVNERPLDTNLDLAAVASEDVVYPNGVTPPLKNVRRRRFRKRISKKTIEVVEREVERLLQEDAAAAEVKYEVHDVVEQGVSDSEIGTPGPGSQEFEEDGFFNEAASTVPEDAGSDFEMDLELEAELQRELGAENENEDGSDREDDDEDDEDGDDEEDEDGSGLEEDDGMSALQLQKSVLKDEITELEAVIERKVADYNNATNLIIKKRFGDVIERTRADLECKKAELAEIDRKLAEG